MIYIKDMVKIYQLFLKAVSKVQYIVDCSFIASLRISHSHRKLQLLGGQVSSTKVHWLPHGPVVRPYYSHSGHLLGVILDGC